MAKRKTKNVPKPPTDPNVRYYVKKGWPEGKFTTGNQKLNGKNVYVHSIGITTPATASAEAVEEYPEMKSWPRGLDITVVRYTEGKAK